jgi:hypothetical protein
MAAAESAANSDAGTSNTKTQLTSLRKVNMVLGCSPDP